MKALKWLGITIVVIAGGTIATFLVAKMADGPIGPFPGGPLVYGDLTKSPITDWTFASAAGEIEMQLLQDTSSRTTWLAVVDTAAYIPAALGFPPNKSWHIRAQQDGAALIRVSDARYPVHLSRLDNNSDEFDQVANALAVENAMPPGGREEMWLFRVSSR